MEIDHMQDIGAAACSGLFWFLCNVSSKQSLHCSLNLLGAAANN
jgi:hypothetical protein